ncbi:hydrogenase expression/formation protein [Natrialba magadii ATCC 43099]|uniref:AIR synthase-like protein domain-containing protein n=1 Tax=Natrialba magadii (strain ATCC 43099 / DSM 3394 / CCM 3739 / CIP 104546 / IAM 13178 / JCM 8861 / NBRC 102185 / NCIMB 2190 / MS3) TaxID=547559 RepID=D3SSD5_NATMM|nr:AIR synthase family protein [Natrialba magadii]ADD04861.1 hydrogenase expression/formation protein [Natrialba magadii ATCC 43099]ELY24446.1 AIR synthase-like protein domain-containing protein [Natrialba magadii ATCC 43099]
MADLGKIDREFFERRIAPNLGADRDDVVLGPTHGVDFGVLDIGGQAFVTATDPLSIPPALGFERAARFALDLVLADVAVSGVAPSHLSVCFTLPETMSDGEFATVWETFHEECVDLGVSVVTGHTARYSDPSHPWVGAATAMGVGEHDEIVRPDGARVGDRLLLTTGPAVESVGLLSTIFADEIDLPADVLADAQERLDEVYAVRDALTAAAAGSGTVTAMHDVTEGGLAGALNEMAAGAGAQFVIDREAVPMRPGVAELCEHLEIDPWAMTSSGSLLIAVDPDGAAAVTDALENRGTVVADIGRVERAESADDSAAGEVVVDGERLDHPNEDPSWAAYAELATE